MPTDNPKISLYVPQQIFDRFKSFQEERKLSMSQAGIVIIAEYFGMEETIKEIAEGTTVGGVTLAEFNQLKQKVLELEKKVERSKTTSEPLIKNQHGRGISSTKGLSATEPSISAHQSAESEARSLSGQQQNQLELVEETRILISADLLAKRLGVKNPKSVGNKKSEVYKNANPNAEDEFYKWTRGRDFDNIGWKPVKEGRKTNYTVKNELPNELLSELQKWVAENVV
jgi:hypothetical protein